uniref:U-scoloptoxin(05)-Er1a n=1 Tax=Ethmostigmus rubripes TaxID=62613 RepID=TX51A_ETHRU|nr:RecName: Full=U-scoloptoxin(05)-Er1a; Short=U-SLPTX(05)-Er1a; Flags: Precursor [Ethmostigmus rubripes]
MLSLGVSIFLLVFLIPENSGLECYQCTWMKNSQSPDNCYKNLPNATACAKDMIYCVTDERYEDDEFISIRRFCSSMPMDGRCTEVGKAKDCKYSCEVDACNFSTSIEPSKVFVFSILAMGLVLHT